MDDLLNFDSDINLVIDSNFFIEKETNKICSNKQTCIGKHEIEKEIIDIDKIIDIRNFDKYNDYKLMENENFLINYLIDNDINQNTQLIYLKWLLDVEKYFSQKLKLPIEKNQCSTILRSSYRFCNQGAYCEYNYNNKKFKGCIYKHYVHNMVYYDICSLINCVENKDNKENKEEINKSLCTISFVLNHMYEELKLIELLKKDNKNYHIQFINKNKFKKI
jgi:hypothetical protein